MTRATRRGPGWMIALAVGLVVVVIWSGAQSAQTARQDARHAAEQRREAATARAEAARMADCMRRVIVTIRERSRFTGPLNDLGQQRLDRLDDMIFRVTDQSLPVDTRRAALREYRAEVVRIRAEMQQVRGQQAKYQFPTLDDCEKG